MSRWLKILLLGLAVAGVALLTLPWWLALPLRPILGHWDITFEHYEREGYAHFRLRQLRYAKGPVEVTAGEVHAPTPLLWLAQRLGATPPRLTAANWRVQPAPGPKTPSAPNPDSGWVRLHATLQRVAARLATWLPQAELANGEVRGFGPRLYFQRVTWHDRQLDADGLGFIGQALAANLATGNNTFLLRAHNRTNEAALQLAWTEADMKGAVTLWTQSAPVTAHFPARGWLPAEASVTAENWTLPAGRVQLGAPYATVQGGARLLWRDTAFEADAEARAVPAPGAKKAPPFSARAAAHGNLRELVLTALAVDAPFAQARLSAPVTFSLDAPATAAPAELAVKVDLGKLPWIDAHGRAEGTVRVTGRDASARQDFVLEFADVELPRIVLKKAQARGHLQWPVLELAGLTAQLDETSTVEAHGALNWQTRELSDVVIKAQAGPAWLAAWLPAGTTWSAAEISATATGPLAAPQLAGSAKVTAFARAPLHPTDVDATWHSAGGVTAVAATARAGGSRLEFAGTIDAQGAELTKLEFSPGGSPVARLVAPARVVFAPAWSVDTLQLAGPGGQLGFQGHGGRDGAFQLSASGFDSAWLRDWVTLSGPAWQLHALRAQGRFERGALVFSTEAAAQIAMNPRPAEVKLGATGDADGVQLQELTVTESGRVLTRISGRLPLSCVLDPDPVVRISETAALELSASTEPDSPLWATLADFTGLQLVEPSARLELKGTVHEPTGQVDLRAARIGAVAGRFPHELPELTELALAARLERAAVTLTTFSAKVDGQAVTARGHVPMDDAGWKQLWSKPAAFDWSQASAQIDIPNADLAPVARRFPKFVAAQGFLRAKIALEPGARFSGELHLRDAATRPLAPFGTLQEIQADLALHDRVLAIQSLGAKLGGEPVALTGGVTFVPGGAPRLALGLKGTNLPVVRNTGLLLRADFDLQADTDAAGVTTLGGRVEVRDCLLLASLNLRTLLPGAKGVTRQPPYFSVEPEPYAHWPLAVDVRARHSIRLRTSVFNGTASGHFRLGGTLGEPRAVGEVTTDEGRVLFPFATFTVKSGSVRLREADPFHAIVALTATSQRRDYQLQLEATGELPSPNILLSSSPALEPGEVLLLVMTGQPPESMATTATNSSGTQRLALLGAYLSRGLFQDLGAGGEDRLEISAGAEVSEQGRDTYEFEYKLGERSSLVGEYDRFDSYNGGFKWRAYTQESTPVEKK